MSETSEDYDFTKLIDTISHHPQLKDALAPFISVMSRIQILERRVNAHSKNLEEHMTRQDAHRARVEGKIDNIENLLVNLRLKQEKDHGESLLKVSTLSGLIAIIISSVAAIVSGLFKHN